MTASRTVKRANRVMASSQTDASPRWQFSLRQLIVCVTIVAILLAIIRFDMRIGTISLLVASILSVLIVRCVQSWRTTEVTIFSRFLIVSVLSAFIFLNCRGTLVLFFGGADSLYATFYDFGWPVSSVTLVFGPRGDLVELENVNGLAIVTNLAIVAASLGVVLALPAFLLKVRRPNRDRG